MQQVIDILQKNAIVFLATADGDQPRVRPFQFQMEKEGKLWFVTANNKDVYAQLRRNPKVEFSTYLPDMTTLRVRGSMSLQDDLEIKRQVLEQQPMIRGIYQTPDNPILATICLEHGEVVIFDFSGKPPRVFSF